MSNRMTAEVIEPEYSALMALLDDEDTSAVEQVELLACRAALRALVDADRSTDAQALGKAWAAARKAAGL